MDVKHRAGVRAVDRCQLAHDVALDRLRIKPLNLSYGEHRTSCATVTARQVSAKASWARLEIAAASIGDEEPTQEPIDIQTRCGRSTEVLSRHVAAKPHGSEAPIALRI